MTAAHHLPVGQDNWCGPVALAYLLRSDPDTAAKLLEAEGRTKNWCKPETMFRALTTAGYNAELILPAWFARQEARNRKRIASDRLRYKVTVTPGGWIPRYRVDMGKRLTLGQWVKWAKPKSDEEYIVGITSHWLVIHGDRYFDSGSHQGKPVPECPYLRTSVHDAHRVTRPPQE